MKNQKPTINRSNLIVYENTDEKNNKLQIFVDNDSLELKGW